ncbi:D-ribose pyranase [Helicovermis profundi]|uniref:D-ribose pyranase n=1 Tax=Helicovermis profundi TaxID=3065157 RepID=A0AAU9E9M5_9FIRM|nr:D-ribose pyranase [Clostridia bacterium S502]
MKKGILLNSEISYVISKLGHTDFITISDAGLPIDEKVKRIDLALKKGIPSFIEVLDTLLNEIVIEKIVLAKEIKTQNIEVYNKIIERINFENKDIKIEFVSHEKFKEINKESKAVIRTGEFSPYANIIIKSGVSF